MDLSGTYNIGDYGTLVVQSGILRLNAMRGPTIENLHATIMSTYGQNGSIDFDSIIFEPQSIWILGSISITGFIDIDFGNEQLFYSTMISLLSSHIGNSNIYAYLGQLNPTLVNSFLSRTPGLQDSISRK